MNDATLEHFRTIADAMSAKSDTANPHNWQWLGRWDSQRMFGITQARAEAYAARHGGTASQMEGR